MNVTKVFSIVLYQKENSYYMGMSSQTDQVLFRSRTKRESIVLGLNLARKEGAEKAVFYNEEGYMIYKKTFMKLHRKTLRKELS